MLKELKKVLEELGEYHTFLLTENKCSVGRFVFWKTLNTVLILKYGSSEG